MRRSIHVRVISFLLCVLAIAVTFSILQTQKLKETEGRLDLMYRRSVYELSDYVSNISVALDKGLYCATPTQAVTLSSQVWRLSGAAQASLTNLPVTDGDAEKLSRYLTQVGDYVYALSQEILSGGQVTEEERQVLSQLCEYSHTVSSQLTTLQHDLEEGSIGVLSKADLPAISDNFQALEEEFAEYPTLIYDGPFSDRLQERESALLYDLPQLSEGEAQERAAGILGVPAGELQPEGEGGGPLPNYTFTGENLFLTVSKQGGLPLVMANSRQAGEGSIDIESAKAIAQQYLDALGFWNMQPNYFSIAGGIATINFAYQEGDVTVYPDLIKVGVSLDQGSVVALDTMAYVMSHVDARAIGKIEFTAEQARAALPSGLEELGYQLCIIPSSGGYELFCHEFRCRAGDGKTYLVYFNAYSGKQENILILIENEASMLTM